MLLRAATGAVLITQGATYFSENREPGLLPAIVISAVMVAVAVLLLIGLLTRFVALLAALVGVSSVFAWFPGSNVNSFDTSTTAVLLAVIAISLICLGPGALSLDARLFGRREIIIPPISSRT
jgi:uncharacterized membrane protein YphA (DoxX/SURF4 family)